MMNVYKYTLPAIFGAVVASLVTSQVVKNQQPSEPVAETRPVEPVKQPEPEPNASAAELERLTKENASLRADLIAARAIVVEHNAKLKMATDQLDELRRPMTADILSSTLKAELKSGEVVVTGGYKLADGRRLYAFAKPVIENINGTDVVMIHGRYLTVTDDVGKTVGLDSLATNAANTLQHGEVWVPSEEESVFSQLETTPDTVVRPYPSLSVRLGRSGTIAIGDIQLKVTPTLGEGVDSLEMELRLEQPQETAEPASTATPAATSASEQASTPAEEMN